MASGCVAAAGPSGGVGAAPRQRRRAWPRAVSRLPVRAGRGGCAPTEETRLASGCVAAAGPSGGVGAAPRQRRRVWPRAVSRLPVRAGGWGLRPDRGDAFGLRAVSRLLIRRGGGGCAPTEETRLASGCVAAAGPSGGVGAAPRQRRRAWPRAVSRLPVRAGAWGRSPHRKKIRGRVGGPERRAAHARPGWGCGGRSPPQETRACPRRLLARRAPDPLTPTLMGFDRNPGAIWETGPGPAGR